MTDFDPDAVPGWSDEEQPQAAESANVTEVTNPEPAPAEPVAAEPAPEPSLDDLLAEWDAVNPAPAPVAPDPIPTATVEAFNKATTDADAARLDYQQKLFDIEQDKQFDAWTGEWQSRMPDWAPPDAFKDKALLAAAANPELLRAFRAHYVWRMDPAAAVAEHNQLAAAVRAGFVPQEQMVAAQQRLEDLKTAVGAKQLLHQAAHRIISEARKHQPYDREATEVRAIVSHAVRGASTSTPPEDPAPDFNRMTDQELRRFTQEKYGFASI